MLVDDDSPTQQRQRRLGQLEDDGGGLTILPPPSDNHIMAAAAVATPQHCSSSQAAPEGACLGAHAVTQKQRNLLELYSALTHTPMPDVGSMGYTDAQAWNRARYSEYLAMIR
eukprot:COSAG06_NODE_1208_length_10261_cov_5.380634_11_plen_113_part_00